MATIENYVNLPSEADWEEIMTKFPAFASASLSAKAKKDLAFENSDYKAGYYFTRTALPGSSDGVKYVGTDGDLRWTRSYNYDTGLRVALQIIYNPECNLVKGCKKVSRTAEIWDKKKGDTVKTTSKAPVVTFGKKEYIWLNKDECENGTEKSMRLVSLELIAGAKPFDKDGNTNDYGSDATKELRQQCQDEAFEFATEEEKTMLVKVRLSKEDGYEKAEPILEKDELEEFKQNPEKFLSLPTSAFRNEAQIDKYLGAIADGLKDVCSNKGSTEELEKYTTDLTKMLSDKIAKEKENIQKEDAEAEKQKQEKQKRDNIVNETANKIRNLGRNKQ